MDSVVKLGHQIKGEPTGQVCHLLILSFSVQKNHPLIVFALYGIFKKLIIFQGIHFYCRQVCLAQRICIDDRRNSNSFFPGGRIYGHEVSGCRGIMPFLDCCNSFW